MKHAIRVFLIVLFSVLFYITFNKIDIRELEKVSNIESQFRKFQIPSSAVVYKSTLADPEVAFCILLELSQKYNVNIFRFDIVESSGEKTEFIKYVLINTNTQYFSAFNLKKGRFFYKNETKEDNNLFISTNNSNNIEQVGVISDFGNNNTYTLKPLKTCYKNLSVDGNYSIEVSDKNTYSLFIEELAQRLNLQKEDFSLNNEIAITTDRDSFYDYLNYIYYVLLFIILLLILYFILKESKKISILKMHGFSNFRLWRHIIGNSVIVTIGALFLITFIVSIIIPNSRSENIFEFMTEYLLYAGIILLISSSLFIYSYFYKIIDILNNKKLTMGIFILNFIFKSSLSIILLLILSTNILNIQLLVEKKQNLKNWEQSMDYGVFYPVNPGNDYKKNMSEGAQNHAVANLQTAERSLYLKLNKMGSLYINSIAYSEESLLINKDYKGINSVLVNNNYLKKFQIYDKNGNPVNVSEDDARWILLVPQKYFDRKSDIINFFRQTRIDMASINSEFFKVPTDLSNQQIEIIWIRDNQKVFSFNMDVFPEDNNFILEPIIEVITEKNSITPDTHGILGQSYRDPLKVKLVNRSSEETLNSLKPELERLGLDDNFKYLVSTNQYISTQIYELKSKIFKLLIIILLLILGLLILITQNVAILFDKFKYKFIIRRMWGLGFFLAFKEFVFILILNFAIIFIIGWFKSDAMPLNVILSIVIVFFIEFIVAVYILKNNEKKDKIKVLNKE